MSQRGIIEYEITPTEIVEASPGWVGLEHLLAEEPAGTARWDDLTGGSIKVGGWDLPESPGPLLAAGVVTRGSGLFGATTVTIQLHASNGGTGPELQGLLDDPFVGESIVYNATSGAVEPTPRPWRFSGGRGGDFGSGSFASLDVSGPCSVRVLRLLLQFTPAHDGPGPVQPELHLETRNFKSGDQTPIVGTLTNRGEPLAFTTATLRVSRGARTQPVLDATIFTDDQGRFAHPWLVPDPGTYIVEATVTVPGAPGQQITAPASGYGTIRVDRRIISGGGGGILL